MLFYIIITAITNTIASEGHGLVPQLQQVLVCSCRVFYSIYTFIYRRHFLEAFLGGGLLGYQQGCSRGKMQHFRSGAGARNTVTRTEGKSNYRTH